MKKKSDRGLSYADFCKYYRTLVENSRKLSESAPPSHPVFVEGKGYIQDWHEVTKCTLKLG